MAVERENSIAINATLILCASNARLIHKLRGNVLFQINLNKCLRVSNFLQTSKEVPRCALNIKMNPRTPLIYVGRCDFCYKIAEIRKMTDGKPHSNDT